MPSLISFCFAPDDDVFAAIRGDWDFTVGSKLEVEM
jgi:hypothetical protein